ncbi:hypothetical protein GN956_G24388 [Arapaima gigas]
MRKRYTAIIDVFSIVDRTEGEHCQTWAGRSAKRFCAEPRPLDTALHPHLFTVIFVTQARLRHRRILRPLEACSSQPLTTPGKKAVPASLGFTPLAGHFGGQVLGKRCSPTRRFPSLETEPSRPDCVTPGGPLCPQGKDVSKLNLSAAKRIQDTPRTDLRKCVQEFVHNTSLIALVGAQLWEQLPLCLSNPPLVTPQGDEHLTRRGVESPRSADPPPPVGRCIWCTSEWLDGRTTRTGVGDSATEKGLWSQTGCRKAAGGLQ